SLTYALGAQAAHGIVVVDPDGSFTYTPNADFNGSDSFTFTASDGTDPSNTPTINLTLSPGGDPPVHTAPRAQNPSRDAVLAIPGLSVADPDSATLTTTLTVANGILSVVPGAALITGNLTGTVTISGAIADINAALAGLLYRGESNFNGPDLLTVATSD